MLRKYGYFYDPAATQTFEMDVQYTTLAQANYTRAVYNVYIPDGVTSLLVNLYAQASAASAAYIMRVIIGGVNLDFANIGPAWSWLNAGVESVIVPGVIGWQDVTIQICKTAAIANWTGYIRGIHIRPNV